MADKVFTNGHSRVIRLPKDKETLCQLLAALKKQEAAISVITRPNMALGGFTPKQRLAMAA